MWKFKQLKGKDKWLFLLTIGVILCILAFPAEKLSLPGKTQEAGTEAMVEGTGEVSSVQASVEEGYEREMEERVQKLLSHVEGVGTVDVMIVLKSSAEKIWQTDENTSNSRTEENGENGSSRQVLGQNEEKTTVRMNHGNEETPMLTKELFPEISGIVISADGGGNPGVQKEISAAMEALFGLPAHKIKVLKRVE